MARRLGRGKTVVTILCDRGDRYAGKLYNVGFLKSRGLPVPRWLEESEVKERVGSLQDQLKEAMKPPE